MKISLLLGIVSLAVAHTIDGIESIQKQLKVRGTNYMDDVYQNLPREDSDFITYHLRQLEKFNGTKCETCKNKVRYGQSLIQEQPDKQHLISLLLFQYCIDSNKGKELKCDNVDFFVTTNTYNSHSSVGKSASDYQSATSVNFYDNDFIQMLKYFNVSSDFDLEFYCFYKSSKACPLPENVDIEKYNFDAKWPQKKEEQYSEPQYNKTSRELFNVLHISDFHNQLRFEMASEANCTDGGLCCLPESYNEDLVDLKDYNFTDVYYDLDPSLKETGFNISFYPDAHYDPDSDEYIKGDYYDYPKYRGWKFNSQPVTTFGSYACDPPEVMLNHSLKHIGNSNSNFSYEFSLFTGDIVDHDEYHCDANTTKFAEIRSYGIMKHFLKDIPVYPTLGNHDTFPYGQLASMEYSNHLNMNDSDYHWNDDLMSSLWTENGWIPEDKADHIKSHYSGFSTVTKRGLKVISLNSNCYYEKNLWAFINLETNPDSFGQWDFLINELVESESKNQRVWILAHVPTGSNNAITLHSKIFEKIVKRFSPYTIANIFYGHTHRDQFKILYDDDDKPLNMAWISQAITPLGPANPSWRYYEVEDESFNIINTFNYYAKLNETFVNGGAEPEWQFEYNPRSFYDPEGDWPTNAPLNATFWDKYVVSNIKNSSNIDFNQKYSDTLYRLAPGTPICANGTTITDDCYNDNFCEIVSFNSEDFFKCVK